MKWVKASERLPEEKGHFIIRRPTLNKSEWVKQETIFNPKYDDIKERWLSFEYEWLDESPLSSNDEDELPAKIEKEIELRHSLENEIFYCNVKNFREVAKHLLSKFNITKRP